MKYTGLDIIELRKKYNWTQSDLAKRIGSSYKTVMNYEKTGIVSKTKWEILDKIIEDQDEFERNETREVLKFEQEALKLTNYKPNNELIPAYTVDFIGGNSFDAVEDLKIKPDFYMDFPDFRGCTAFKAYSDSMEGIIKSGSWLFGTKVERWNEYLEFGQIYGIVCEDGRKFLKYIKKFKEAPKEYFLLVSENDFYEDFEMPKSYITSIWLIHGHVTKRL